MFLSGESNSDRDNENHAQLILELLRSTTKTTMSYPVSDCKGSMSEEPSGSPTNSKTFQNLNLKPQPKPRNIPKLLSLEPPRTPHLKDHNLATRVLINATLLLINILLTLFQVLITFQTDSHDPARTPQSLRHYFGNGPRLWQGGCQGPHDPRATRCSEGFRARFLILEFRGQGPLSSARA